MAKTLSKKDIAERIAESILDSAIINKESIVSKVEVQLTIWQKLTERPVNYDNIKTDKGKLQVTIETRDIERKFWLDKLREAIGEDSVKPFYDELRDLKKELGY